MGIEDMICNVLSIDGGGVWGIGVAKYLSNIEMETGKKINDSFAAFSGTSTGAIIAALLNEGYSATEIYRLYDENLTKIFKSQPWYNKLNPYKPKYVNDYLKKMLQQKLKGNMSDFDKPIFIPVSCSKGTTQKVFDLGDNDMPKWKAVLASASAPTYFEPVDGMYMDGGLWANNPADVLQAGLVSSSLNGKYRMVSICSSGDDNKDKNVSKMNLLSWGKYLISDWLTGSGEGSSYRTKKNIGEENFLRIKPKTKNLNIDLDDVNKSNKIVEVWDNEYNLTKDKLKKFIGVYRA